MDLTSLSKDTTWQTGFKKQTPQSVRKTPTLLIEKKLCIRVEGWKNIYQAYSPPKQAGEAILISNKVEFKPKLVRRDKEGHFLRITGAIHQVEIQLSTCMCPNHCAHVHETYMSDLKITERPQYHHSGEYTRSNRNKQ
jgi:hypothetical protein